MNIIQAENNFKPSDDGKSAEAEHGMVASAFPEATEAGVDILKGGGNAIDAACACALALGVCEPQASGLGGQTMMLIHSGKKTFAIDGSSRAPSLAHVNAIYERDRARGYRATTVPSTLATLVYVHQKFGQLPWAKLVEPAIRIAEDGYKITPLQNKLQVREFDNFNKIESGSGKKYFYKDGYPFAEGDVFKQPELAAVLNQIADDNVHSFYSGSIAKRIDSDMRENGGLLRYDDLALIPWPIERKAMSRRFRQVRVFTMPPPGAGRVLLFTLAMINAIPQKRFHKNITKRAHLLAEIFRQALLDRSDRPFDSNFYPQVSETERMISSKYAFQCITQIARSVDPQIPIRESFDEMSGETTHLAVMDEFGMAVSLTQSIERAYGSKSAADGLGFLYNNYLMDFDYKLPSHPFYLRPNATPWSTVAPSILFNGKRLWMAVGSPGSERSISAITQFLIHLIDEGMDLDQAMREPRMHCSLGGKLSIEGSGFEDNIVEFFRSRNYRIDERERYSFYLGAIHAVLKKQEGKGFQGVAEVRRDGSAKGY